MNYVIFRKFLTNHDCQFLTAVIDLAPEPKDLGLIDGEKSDTWHKSKRNKGMEYIYSTNEEVLKHLSNIKQELTNCTEIAFTDELSSKAAVFCKYGMGGVSNPHRDRDKTDVEVIYQCYTAICLLTDTQQQPDEFFINFEPVFIKRHIAMKSVFETEDSKKNRFYPNLNKGDVIIFRNDISIHGVDPVVSSDCRITTAFRSK